MANNTRKLNSNTGLALIKLLNLQLNEYGRVDTAIGDKSEYGLAKTIDRIFTDDKFAQSLARGEV